MGAEAWIHFVPFQPDPLQALHKLKLEVFRKGEFEKPSAEIDFLDEMGFFEVSDPERAEMILDYGLAALSDPIQKVGISGFRQWLVDLDAASTVQTIEELNVLATLSSQGFRTVLDMRGISSVIY